MDRRTTLQWILAAGAGLPMLAARPAWPAPPRAQPATRAGQGYGTDPNLLAVHHAGELWPLTLSAQQRRLAERLCDLILPADGDAPAASAVGVVDFIDEWISAPYPGQQRDRTIVLAGLAWLDLEAKGHLVDDFLSLGVGEQLAICDDLNGAARTGARHAEQSGFFARYRDLTVGAYYCSPAGRTDLGYIGNVALTRFEGPPLALLRQLGLE